HRQERSESGASSFQSWIDASFGADYRVRHARYSMNLSLDVSPIRAGVVCVLVCGWLAVGGARADEPNKPLVYVGMNPQGYAEYVRQRDGMRMVHVPAGEYMRRAYEGATAVREPEPAKVAGFLIDKFEVTNEQFA